MRNGMRRFLNAFTKPMSSGPATRRRAGAQLLVEVLEDRTVPSTLHFTVNNLGDTGTGIGTQGDLRYCINQANLNNNTNAAQPDTIAFAPGLHGTITLLLGELDITDPNLNIYGPGAFRVAVSGNNANRVFDIEAGTKIFISALTIENGHATGDGLPDGSNEGGGILNKGNLTLFGDVVQNNTAEGLLVQDGQGGGIFSSGALSLSLVVVQGNTAGGGLTSTNGEGGGIYSTAALKLSGDVVQNNTATNTGQGGGVFATGLSYITACRIQGNNGTGIDLDSGSDNSRISANLIYNNSGFGINLSSSNHDTVQGNALWGNQGGIELQSATYNSIAFNQIHNNSADGIELVNSSNNSVIYNFIFKNGTNGIELMASSNNTIRGNVALFNGNDGILLDAASSGNTVQRNFMFGNTNFDAEDDSIGGGTAGTANTWQGNFFMTAKPSGLH